MSATKRAGAKSQDQSVDKFRRRLEGIAELEMLARSKVPNWWQDLLRHWRPAGESAGNDGLRLAIRDNYLNFYRKGQSVARVHFGKDGLPCASVHLEYLGVKKPPKGKEYARLQGDVFVSRVLAESISFHAGHTITDIIKEAESHAGTEKHFVDIALDDNPAAVDLEIGLPKPPGLKGAQRIDLAILEKRPDSNQIELVFWEAKTIDDPRLKSSDPKPEVICQLRTYEKILSEGLDNFARQYKETCALLVELSKMAGHCDNNVKLSELVTAVARGETILTIDAKPRLVIFEGQAIAKGEKVTVKRVAAWDQHQRKLTEEFGVVLAGPFSRQPYDLIRQ